MLIELGILLLIILICITVWIALQYFGLFEEIEVSAGPPPYQFGGRLMAYKKQRGCYSDSSAIFTEVCSIVPGLDTIGIYLDDPNKHQKNKCRYIVGALLNKQEEEEEDQQLEDQKQLLISKGFVCGQLPAVDHVVYSLFPFKGIISVVIAIRRVYPRIRSFIAEHNLCAHPGIEVYSGDDIYFMFPLAKQDQFYQLYGTVDHNDETDDNSNAEEDETEDEVLNNPQNNDNKSVEQVSSIRLRSSKGSKHSSTSSSFEELIAEDNGKES